MIRLLSLSATILLFLPAGAAAELTNCDGVWTDRPCSQGVLQRRTDVPDAAAPTASTDSKETQRALSQKRSLLHDVTMKSIRAKDQYNLTFSLTGLEQDCLKPETAVADCEKKTDEMHEKIDKRVTEAAAVAEQAKSNKLREEANRLTQERNEIETNKPVVVVTETRRYPYYRDPRSPGYYENTQSGASIGVSVSGNSGNTSVGIAGQAGSSTSSGYGTGPVYSNDRPGLNRPGYDRPVYAGPISRDPALSGRGNTYQGPQYPGGGVKTPSNLPTISGPVESGRQDYGRNR